MGRRGGCKRNGMDGFEPRWFLDLTQRGISSNVPSEEVHGWVKWEDVWDGVVEDGSRLKIEKGKFAGRDDGIK